MPLKSFFEKKPDHHPKGKKNTNRTLVKPGDTFENTAFEKGFEIVKF
jgi:hypothetical protein